MLELILTKAQNGRDQVETFGNRYLYSGNNTIESNEVKNLLLNLQTAEAAFYPTETNFVRGICREVDNNVVAIKGRTRSIPLEGQGTFVIPDGDKLAPAHVCAVVERAAILGRPGYGYYRYCTTVSEYEAWLKDRTVPARFSAANTTIGGNTSTVWLAMLNSVGLGTLTPVLPDAWGDTLNAPRPIVSITFGGFKLNDPKRPKKSARAQLIEGFQSEINELGRRALQAYKEWTDGTTDVGDVAVIVDLATQAARIYYSMPVAMRGALKWPKIFKTLPPTNPGNIPQLPVG